MQTRDGRRERISFFLVDRHPLALEGLALLLAQKGFEIVGESNNPAEALQLILQTLPDMVMVDIHLGDTSGIDLIGDLKKMAPQIPVLVCAIGEGPFYEERVKEAGASGYISKQEMSGEILVAVKRIMEGGMFFRSYVLEEGK